MNIIYNVEIFKTGTWRGVGSPPTGDHYTTRDLQAMVEAFSGGAIKPNLKITHGSDSEQVNIGQVGNLRVQGGKLLGDFVNLDGNLYQLMKKGLFKARSAEVLWNMRDRAGKTWRRVLKAVALLTPGQKPAVPLTEGYQFEKLYSYQWPHEGGTPMTICELGKQYHAKVENEEKQRGKLMQKGGSALDSRARELMDSGEEETYKEAFEKAMEEDSQSAKMYLEGIGG